MVLLVDDNMHDNCTSGSINKTLVAVNHAQDDFPLNVELPTEQHADDTVFMHSSGSTDKGDQDILHDACNVEGVKHNEHEKAVSKCKDIQAATEDVSAIMLGDNTIGSSWPIDVVVVQENIEASSFVETGIPLDDVEWGLVHSSITFCNIKIGIPDAIMDKGGTAFLRLYDSIPGEYHAPLVEQLDMQKNDPLYSLVNEKDISATTPMEDSVLHNAQLTPSLSVHYLNSKPINLSGRVQGCLRGMQLQFALCAADCNF